MWLATNQMQYEARFMITFIKYSTAYFACEGSERASERERKPSSYYLNCHLANVFLMNRFDVDSICSIIACHMRPPSIAKTICCQRTMFDSTQTIPSYSGQWSVPKRRLHTLFWAKPSFELKIQWIDYDIGFSFFCSIHKNPNIEIEFIFAPIDWKSRRKKNTHSVIRAIDNTHSMTHPT